MDHPRWSLAGARRAADEGALEEWVRDFLTSEGGDNSVLAAAIALRDCYWAGPLEVDVDELQRVANTEDRLPSPAEPEGRDDAGDDNADDDSSPPPLLAEHVDGRLVLEDGHHRYEALVASGARRAWVILLFPDPPTRAEWLASHARAAPG